MDAAIRWTDVRAALKEGMAQLRAAKVPSYTLAAELLLMHALGRDRTWLYTHPEAELEASVARRILYVDCETGGGRAHAISDRQAGILGIGI